MKRFSVILTVICLMAALFVIAAPAASAEGYTQTQPKTTVPSGYTGIYTAADLSKISKSLNSSYILMADIDLANAEFTPIGTEAKPFGGVFDGNGHTIKNFKITASGTQKASYLGLFGCSTGTVKNLVISGMNITAEITNGKLCVGGIAGRNQGTISNCKVTVNISGKANATVSTKNAECIVGGITGENRSNSGMYGKIKNCEVYGTIVSEATVPETSSFGYAYAGGVAGQNSVMSTSISCCTNFATVTINAGNHAIGGGIVGDQLSATTSYCINRGAVKVIGGNVIAGGIAGSNNMSGEVFCCCNHGTVNASSEYRSFTTSSDTTQTFGSIRIGGVLGENSHSTLGSSYSMGKVSYTKSGDVTIECGGAYGAYEGGPVSDCYYLNSSVTVTDAENRIDKAISSSDFAKASTFENFDFISAWEMSPEGYPTLTMNTVHVHTPSEWTVKSEPNCTDSGREIIVCTTCNEVLEARDIPALGHLPGEWVTVEPTCTESGRRYCVCMRCHEEIESEELAPKGHTPGAAAVVEATCHSEGSRTVSCSVCGAVLEYEAYPMMEHTPGEWTVSEEPTCTHEGTKERRCTICGELLATEKIAPNGHTTGEWTIVKEATCTEDGSKTRSCTVCGETFTQRIRANGHTAGEWVVTVEPTCQETGTKVKTCTVCGETIETETIPTVEHSYVNGKCEYCGAEDPALSTETENTETKATEATTSSETDKSTDTSKTPGKDSKSTTTIIIIIVVAVVVLCGAAVLIYVTSKKK